MVRKQQGAAMSFTGFDLSEVLLDHGAEAFRRDVPEACVIFLDTGHFALETHAADIAVEIRDFLS
jgi:3'-phosphoadenosine 5'-phosphosulfate sulfotransferase (PAPS reductase)/FAD synthetase